MIYKCFTIYKLINILSVNTVLQGDKILVLGIIHKDDNSYYLVENSQDWNLQRN